MHGFVVLECEEIERAALLFNSDFNPRLKLIKNGLHLLAAPSQQIVATSLTALVDCMRRGQK